MRLGLVVHNGFDLTVKHEFHLASPSFNFEEIVPQSPRLSRLRDYLG